MKMQRVKGNKLAVLLLALLLCLSGLSASGLSASADSLSADNSLSSLGITTEGATVSPEFAYGTTVYEVTVPAGTTSLSLDPTPSNSAAYISSISGTELSNGSATVSIVVVAENGDAYTYYLYVTEEAAEESETEPETQTEEQTETEAETEDPRYVSVARETLEEAQNTIDTLKSETSSYRDRVNLLTKILYGMIGLCVVLLFAVINLLLKRKDLTAELRAYRGLDYSSGRKNPPDEDRQRSQKDPKQKKKKNKKEKKVIVVEENQRQTMEESSYMEDEFERTGKDTFYEQEQPSKRRLNDDPTTVPKPSRAKTQTKRMPEYEPLREQPRYEPPKEPQNGSQEVDIDYIDL